MDAAGEHQLLKIRMGKQPENLKISLCQKHKATGKKKKVATHHQKYAAPLALQFENVEWEGAESIASSM